MFLLLLVLALIVITVASPFAVMAKTKAKHRRR